MKSILICCNSMGIGGVETVILNQVISFTKKGYQTYVIAKNGEYSHKVNELGGEFIDFDFPEENEINIDRVNQIVDIIREKKITEIHIHKYQCIPSILLAALITEIPYFAYEHGVKDTKKYYTWNYPIYKFLFPIYFENAYKIIAITPKVAEITKNEYGFSDDKYIIVHNGIDFDMYKNQNLNFNNSIKKVLIVSRIDNEKMPTIYNGIDFFNKILSIDKSIKLDIIGGGNSEKELIEYLNKIGIDSSYDNKEVTVRLLGKQTDISKFLERTDLLLGVGRCVLEAIAMKVPTVITGYDGINGLVTVKNIDVALEENFSGINMPTLNEEECINDYLMLKENKRKIVEDVYEIAKDKLDCCKNYITIPEDESISFNWFHLFNVLKEYSEIIGEQSIDIKNKNDCIQKIESEKQKMMEKDREIEQKNNELRSELKDKEDIIFHFKKELNEVYNSKRWKYSEKLSKIFHK